MGTIAVNDIIRITARMVIDTTNEVVGVWHHKCLVTNAGDDLAFMTAAAIVFDNRYTLINGEVTNRLDYVTIEGQNVTASRLLPTLPWPVLVSGLTASEMLPETVAACVFFPTLRPKTRASKFLGGYTEASNLGGLLSAGALTALGLFGAAFVGGFVADAASMQYGAWNQLFLRFTPVSSHQVPLRWRTQRRRRFGVGS